MEGRSLFIGSENQNYKTLLKERHYFTGHEAFPLKSGGPWSPNASTEHFTHLLGPFRRWKYLSVFSTFWGVEIIITLIFITQGRGPLNQGEKIHRFNGLQGL